MRRFVEHDQPRLAVRGEPAFALLTHLSQITLWAFHQDGPNNSVIEDARRLEQEGTLPSPEFNAIFGHGFGLRDALATAHHPDQSLGCSIASFMSFLDSQDSDFWTTITEDSIYTGLDFAEMAPPTQEIDIASPTARHALARLIAAPDLGASEDAVEAILADPGGSLRAHVMRAIVAVRSLKPDEFWNSQGFDELARSFSQTARDADALAAFRRMTGRSVPPGELQRITSSPAVTFLMTPGLGPEFSISYFPAHAVVAFEPATLPTENEDTEWNSAASLFAALGNHQRLLILDALQRHGEMFGSAIAETLDIPQATVSNHLTMLEQVRLVGRRPAGRRIYYSLDQAGIDRAGRLLQRFGLEAL